MNNTRAALAAAIVLAGIAASGISYAQAPAAPPATTRAPAIAPTPSKPSAITRVEAWTTKQWNAAKKEWAKDKAKWASCQKQSKAQQLSGRKSWSFLYQCMTG
jgi:hypothetical protein